MKNNLTRERIVIAADKLFYEQGFEFASFSHIAEVVNISRGNFYYHFKTKDDILSAVIELRLENTINMLNKWAKEQDDPIARIRCFIHILIMNQAKIIKFGCPVGSLTTELAKLNHEAHADATQVFTVFREWLCEQFLLLGCSNKSADEFALHVLGRSQGVATLASAFKDKRFVAKEVELMCEWLDTLSFS